MIQEQMACNLLRWYLTSNHAQTSLVQVTAVSNSVGARWGYGHRVAWFAAAKSGQGKHRWAANRIDHRGALSVYEICTHINNWRPKGYQ